jgi:sporulation protein YunB
MRKNKGFLGTSVIITIILLTLFTGICTLYDRYVLPAAISVSQKYAITTVNNEIQRAVNSCIEDMGVKSEDFIGRSEYGDTSEHYVNTVLVNRICAKIASDLSGALNVAEVDNIELPIGVYTGMSALSNLGPHIKVRIDQMGAASVDYDTKFESAGVNQVNMQIWLNISSDVAIVNPGWSKELAITRRIMLVNTVYSGKIPEAYLNIDKIN